MNYSMFNIRKLKSLRKSKPRVRGFSSAARHEAGRASVEARELELFQELAKKYLPTAFEKPKHESSTRASSHTGRIMVVGGR